MLGDFRFQQGVCFACNRAATHWPKATGAAMLPVDYRGEVYGIARSFGVRTAQVKARLGDPEKLPSVAEANRDILP